MARVLADHEYLAMTPDDLALIAHFLDRRTYLHISFLSVNVVFYRPRPAAGDYLLTYIYRCFNHI